MNEISSTVSRYLSTRLTTQQATLGLLGAFASTRTIRSIMNHSAYRAGLVKLDAAGRNKTEDCSRTSHSQSYIQLCLP